MGLTRQYTDDELDKLRKIELEILKDVTRVIEKYQLHYFIHYGTLIGAIRHNGYIPWDDDIDICMFREDYQVLKKFFDKELGEKYILADPLLVDGYSGAVIKVMKKGTRFVSDFQVDMKCELGIFIDIFVLDRIEENRKRAVRRIKKTRILSRMIFLCGSKNPVIPFQGIKLKLAQFVCVTVHYILNIVPGMNKILYKKFVKVSTGCKEVSTKVAVFQCVVGDEYMLDKESYFPLIDHQFENIIVKIPSNYDELLRLIYGDYMRMPPVEERVNHRAVEIDFGDKL